jgi:hypothetical protein
MNKKMTYIKILVVLICAAAVYGEYLYNKPHQSAATQTADRFVAADALYHQYEKNEHVADSMYTGKIIEVKGVLASVDLTGEADILELSPQATGGGISCQMFAHDKSTAPVYPAIGSIVIIKGKCTGFLMDVNLVDCGIEKPPTP